MSRHSLVPASALPADVLFPEAYEESKRTLVRDFAFFGSVIVLSVVAVAAMGALF